MPETVHTSALMSDTFTFGDDDRQTMIDVSDVTMIFNVANQRLNSLKEYFIAFAKRQLFFREFTALSDVSLTVKKGDVFGILGTNGSGKSTLLKIIAGVLEPTRGTVTINGHIAPLIELGAGFDMELTARENIYLNGSLLGYPRKFIAQHFDDIVDFAEIRQFLDMPLKNYSSGMVARIAFAIATVIVPEILIVDEVLSVGDFMFQQKCEERIQKLIKEYGTTVLIVSHSNDQIARLCNKALWIEKGHMRLMGDAQVVCQTYRALGGHLGTAESERQIFNIMHIPYKIPEHFYATIEAPDVYEMTARLATVIDETSVEGVVFSPAYDDLARYIALNYYRALGYLPLVTPTDELPNSVSLALKRLEPKKAIFIERDAFPVSARVLAQVTELCPGVEIERNISHMTDEMAAQSVHALEAAGIGWTKRAVALSPACHKEFCQLLTEDRFDFDGTFTAHRESSPKIDPVLFIDQLAGDDDALAAQIDEQLSLYPTPIEKVLIIGDRLESSACPRLFEERNCAVEIWDRAETASDTLASEDASGEADGAPRALDDPVSLIVIASDKNVEAALSAAPLAHRLNMPMIFENHDDLDSVAKALAEIDSHDGSVNGLLFVGDGNCFEAIDKMILAKGMIRCRIESGVDDASLYQAQSDASGDELKPKAPAGNALLESLSPSSLHWQ